MKPVHVATDDEVRALGYQPTRDGWVPIEPLASQPTLEVSQPAQEPADSQPGSQPASQPTRGPAGPPPRARRAPRPPRAPR